MEIAKGKRSIPFMYRLLIGFGMLLLLWIGISALNIVTLHATVEANQRLLASQHRITLASNYLHAAFDALASQRGYLLTSERKFLSLFRSSVAEFTELHHQLSALVRNNPEQKAHLEEASNLIQQWVYDVARVNIDVRSRLPVMAVPNMLRVETALLTLENAYYSGERERAPPQLLRVIENELQLVLNMDIHPELKRPVERAHEAFTRFTAAVANGASPAADEALRRLHVAVNEAIGTFVRAEDQIRANVNLQGSDHLVSRFNAAMTEFVEGEQRLLEENWEETRARAARVTLLIRLGPAIGLLVMLLITAWITHRLGKSMKSLIHAANELARGNLKARANVSGRDELGVLAERFNVMADLIGSRSRESAAFAELGELLQSCNSIDEATRVFASMSAKMLPDHAGVLYLISPSRDDISAVSEWNEGSRYSDAFFAPHQCWSLRLGRTHDNIEGRTMACEHLIDKRKPSVCLPLHAFGETIGLLFVVYLNGITDSEQSIQDQHHDFLESVSEQLALALANLKLRETLRNQSIRDPLTGLYNRRYLDESIRRELHRAERHGHPVSVLAFDIDHFKNFNDTHGHDGGDALLRAVGHHLDEFFRAEDGAYRAGGEEFVAVLAGTSLEDALARAEELRRTVAELEVAHENLVLPPVTISVGVATFPEHGTTPEQLFKAADQALYRAKRGGRNQVRHAGEPQE